MQIVTNQFGDWQVNMGQNVCFGHLSITKDKVTQSSGQIVNLKEKKIR